MLDIVIHNGTLIDGTGKSDPEVLDIGVKGDEIVEIGKLLNYRARHWVDAHGRWVTPGFIDSQNHSDAFWSIFDYPGQESLLTQGVTTISMGHCGASLAPLPSMEAFKSIQKWRSLEGQNFNWLYFDEFIKEISKKKLGVNTVSLVGHSTLRRGLLGDETRKVSEGEIKTMERLLFSSFKTGAAGLSYGLVYAHEYDASKEELVQLAKVTAQAGRLISVHLRSEGSHILEALDEAIYIAEKSGAELKLSHLKVRGVKNWDLHNDMLQKVEQAYQHGVKMSFDVYPYTSSWSVLYTYLPKWAYEGGKNALNKRLGEPFLRKRIVGSLDEQKLDFSKVTIATATAVPHLVGRSMGRIAADQGVSVNEALLNVLSSTESEVIVFDENILQENLEKLIKSPLSMISSDGAGFSHQAEEHHNLVHPRCFGTFPRFLSMVRKSQLLKPKDAIYKITGKPAEVLKLKTRGLLKEGYKADIAILDPKQTEDNATLQNPYQFASGIEHLIVNGQFAISNGSIVNPHAGEVIKEFG